MSVLRPRVLVAFAAGTLLVAGGCAQSPTAPAAEPAAAPSLNSMDAEASGYIIAGGRSEP